MSRETPSQKATRYLTEGRVTVLGVEPDQGVARVQVLGSDPHRPYLTRCSHGSWTCTCPARIQRCAHVLAASLICPTPQPQALRTAPVLTPITGQRGRVPVGV